MRLLPSWACWSCSENSAAGRDLIHQPRLRRALGIWATVGGNSSGSVALSGWSSSGWSSGAGRTAPRCRPACSPGLSEVGGVLGQRARQLVWPGRQDRDHVLDAADVLERVERELERLAAQQQQAVGRRLPDADRAVLAADPAQVVGDRVAAQQRHGARGRVRLDRHLEAARRARRPVGRRLLRRRSPALLEVDDRHHRELIDRREPVERRDVVGDLPCALRCRCRRRPDRPRRRRLALAAAARRPRAIAISSAPTANPTSTAVAARNCCACGGGTPRERSARPGGGLAAAAACRPRARRSSARPAGCSLIPRPVSGSVRSSSGA